MSYRPSSVYSSNTSSLGANAPAHTALQVRINSKRAELENLKQLRDLSATLAAQMSALEQKLATLRDGTEAVATVLKNWDGVLGVIGMAGVKVQKLAEDAEGTPDQKEAELQTSQPTLPVTLVRIPVTDTNRAGDG